MYHTKMYPNFLLLPKCSKIKSYINPLTEAKITSYKKSQITHNPSSYFIQPFSRQLFLSKQIVLCACIKMYINILFLFISLYKAK